ncbi:MAG: hypothetical protein AAGF93_23005 [Cyanobacteria bacterium P01_H01_bin.105]
MALLLIKFSTSNSIDEVLKFSFYKENLTAVKLASSRPRENQPISIGQYNRQYWLTINEDGSFAQQGEAKLMADAESNILQVNFSNTVGPDTIEILHISGLNDERATAIRELIDTAGGRQLVPVYELSQEEIIQDNYGFSRAFKLYLKSEANPNQAIEILECSPLIESVRSVGIQRIFNQ